MSPDGKKPTVGTEASILLPLPWPAPPMPLMNADPPNPLETNPEDHETEVPATQPRSLAYYGEQSPSATDQSVTSVVDSPAWLQREIIQEEFALQNDIHEESHEASWLFQQMETENKHALEPVSPDLTVGSSEELDPVSYTHLRAHET